MKSKSGFLRLTIAVFLIPFLYNCISFESIPGKREPDTLPEAPETETDSRETISPGLYSSQFSPEAATVIARTYARTDTPGGRVLKAAMEMVDKKVIVLGGCWGYVNRVYDNAHYPQEKREQIFKGEKDGPYANHAVIMPGDWIMYCNLPYGEIGHSAIFVEWIDFRRRSALTIEYVGGNRKIPGRFREADITKTFGILRPTD
jgi:hypothetical protein